MNSPKSTEIKTEFQMIEGKSSGDGKKKKKKKRKKRKS